MSFGSNFAKLLTTVAVERMLSWFRLKYKLLFHKVDKMLIQIRHLLAVLEFQDRSLNLQWIFFNETVFEPVLFFITHTLVPNPQKIFT